MATCVHDHTTMYMYMFFGNLLFYVVFVRGFGGTWVCVGRVG